MGIYRREYYEDQADEIEKEYSDINLYVTGANYSRNDKKNDAAVFQ